MTLTPTQVALVEIALRRNAAREDMLTATAQDRQLNAQYLSGLRAGLQQALDILRNAEDEDGNWVFPVASAEYIASQ